MDIQERTHRYNNQHVKQTHRNELIDESACCNRKVRNVLAVNARQINKYKLCGTDSIQMVNGDDVGWTNMERVMEMDRTNRINSILTITSARYVMNYVDKNLNF